MKKSFLKTFINEFELYAATVLFILMTVLLFLQVVSRHIFSHSLTVMEELALILFIWVVYLSAPAAVLKRKHMRVEFVLDMLPQKIRRFAVIFDHLIVMVYCLLMLPPIAKLIYRLYKFHFATSLLRIPKSLTYAIIPFSLTMVVIRTIQEIITIAREDEKTAGETVGSLDLDACEREYHSTQVWEEDSP